MYEFKAMLDNIVNNNKKVNYLYSTLRYENRLAQHLAMHSITSFASFTP